MMGKKLREDYYRLKRLITVGLILGNICSSFGKLKLVERHSGLRLATRVQVEEEFQSVMAQMGHWFIANFDDGRVLGAGYGGQIVDLDPNFDSGHEIAVLGEFENIQKPPPGNLFSKDHFGKDSVIYPYSRFEMEARHGYRVHLTFFTFSSTPSGTCKNDRIFVEDTNGDKVHKFCGNSEKPISIMSSGNTLAFELDSFKKSSQFLATWKEVEDNFVEYNEGKYLISFPHIIIENSTEQVCIDLFSTQNERGDGNVTFKVFSQEDLVSGRNQPSYENSFSFSTNENKQCKSLTINLLTDSTKAFINFEAFFENSHYGFTLFKEIEILPQEIYDLIQTDKGQYKPNDTVKFRILLLDEKLKPAQISTVDEIWIEDSNNNRIHQWLNEALSRGILQQEFTLSEEPVLGSWTINFKTGDLQKKTPFKVAEYILPKFEVTIKPTSPILRNSLNITWNVCGTYTHGGSVKGLVNWNITTGPVNLNRKAGMVRQPIINGHSRIGSGQDCATVAYIGKQGNTISLDVEFEEEGTGIKIAKSWTGSVLNKEIKLAGEGNPNKFTVGGFPYIGGFRTSNHDGTPAVGTLLDVCWKTNIESEYSCQNGNTDENGIYKFYVPSSSISTNAHTMTVTARARDYPSDTNFGMIQPENEINIELNQINSSKSFMIETMNHAKIPCNEHFDASIYASSAIRKAFNLHYYVLTKGKLYKTGKLTVDPAKDVQVNYNDLVDGRNRLDTNNSVQNEMVDKFLTKKTVSIYIDYNVASTIELMVFSHEDENVTVIDSHSFEVNSCQNHQVNFEWSHTKVNPGLPVNIKIRAESDSLCGISVADKSVDLHGNLNVITQEKMEKLLQDIGERTKSENTKNCNELISMLQNSGISILSNLPHLESCYTLKDAIDIPDIEEQIKQTIKNRLKGTDVEEPILLPKNLLRSDFGLRTDVEEPILLPSNLLPSNFEIRTDLAQPILLPSNFGIRTRQRLRPMPYNVAAPIASISDGIAQSQGGASSDALLIKSFLVEKATVKKPKIELRSYFPETWLFQLNNTDINGELTMNTNSPHTITEWQGGAFCINQQQGLGVASSKSMSVVQDFFAEINLPYSVKRGEIVSLNISLFNKIQSQLPAAIQISAKTDDIKYENIIEEVCVEARNNVVVPFKIKALKLGKHDITASAKIVHGIPGCTDVKEGEGYTDALVKRLLVKPEGFPVEKVQTKLECFNSSKIESFEMAELDLPLNYVRESERGWVQITSDVMAPALQNIDKLVSLPTGCGEQNMIGLVPNIYLLQYLDATNKREPELKEKAKSFMGIGYNRQQHYRHEDGSFSIWGTSKHNAHFRRGVDEGSTWLTAFVVKSFSMAAKFIDIDRRLLQQSVDWLMNGQMEDGCFRKSGYVHHKELVGVSSNASLTPFVFTALLEARFRLDANLDEAKLMKAMDCMLETFNISDAYTSVLSTYAANRLIELENQFIIPEQMKEKILLLWPHVLEKNPVATTNSASPSIWSNHTPKTEAVEMTAYNLMTLLMQGNVSEASKVAKWLAEQRNSQGGFISTQDTVVALQALSIYASKVTLNNLDMSVKIIESHPRILDQDSTQTIFNITHDNALLLQSKKITELPNNIKVVMDGEGCVMIQTVLKYNVHEKEGNKGFKLAVFNQDDNRMSVCAQYTGNKEQTNMIVVEVEMVTGWQLHRESVEELLNEVDSRVRKYEILEKENKVVLYFDDMPKNLHCIEMEVKLVTEVKDAKAAIASIYDYYDMEEVMSIKYHM